MLWRYGAGRREGTNLKIPVYLLKKSTLAEITSIASDQETNLRSIRVANDTSARPFWDDRKRKDRPRRFWRIITASLAITFVGLISWQETTETRSLQSRITLLKIEKATLSGQAIEMRTKLDTENTSFAAIARDLELFKAEYHRLPILLDLTETLSDETWISEAAISGSDLHLSGFTAQDVTEVMTSLREFYWVQRIDLSGPVSFDSFSRRNRFDLSIKLRSINGARP